MSSDTKNPGAKVVSITGTDASTASDRALVARLPAPVHATRERGAHLFSKLLRTLFDNADDALFALADKATSNHDQNLYFESMREVRIRRRDMEAKFARSIDEGFLNLVGNPPAPEQGEPYASASASGSGLSLVGDEELEELVAIESMVAKANKNCGESLQYLSLRLDSLVPNKVYQKTNPLGPELICAAFARAVRGLDAEVKARLVLFKLFEQYVVSQLPEVYDSLNEVLIENNVLPSLQHQKPEAEAAPSRTEAPAEEPGGDRQQEQGSTQVNIYVASSDLLGALTLLQGSASEPRDRSVASVRNLNTDLTGRLLEVLNEQHGERALSRTQMETINLVKLLFDFILDDSNLAEPMKALIGRLQIPVLKVALVDDSFFNKRGHPARRLLNEMATASLGWQENPDGERPRDPLYQKIDEIVQRLLGGFETDVGIFDEVLAEFVSFVERERRRASILERRTVDAEDGKARAETAREQVTEALAGVLKGQAVPPSVRNLLDTAWSNVLFLIRVKHGADSEEWQRALQTAEDLVWSVTVVPGPDSRQKLLGMIPHLVKRLRDGLERISFNPFEMTQLLNRLEKIHLARLQPGSPAAAELESESEAWSGSADQIAEPMSAEAEMEAVESEAAIHVEDEFLAMVDRLTQGAWFEMVESSGKNYRCRLAAIIKPTGKYIFVNRSGMKVAEQSREGLALALQQDQLKPLDDSMLFERALESVIGGRRDP
ncbi:DUF1631 domain-containing protein [Gilvimarinus sp. F26214L]|uniref:DUF1631 domain-containing protein n=1 Tax=Gilvimarinus sp. DZF01 TaxID=3461371 RepID=UPI004045EBD4